jgi:hypothetical protein
VEMGFLGLEVDKTDRTRRAAWLYASACFVLIGRYVGN